MWNKINTDGYYTRNKIVIRNKLRVTLNSILFILVEIVYLFFNFRGLGCYNGNRKSFINSNNGRK